MIKFILVLKSCILYFILFFHFSIHSFYFTFLIKDIRNSFHLWNIRLLGLWRICRRENKHPDVHPHPLGPSIFCREIEEARPMMEEMDGKNVYFAPESAFLTLMCWCFNYFSLIFTLAWRVSNCVSRQGNLKIGEMKVQKQKCYLFWSTDDNTQYC